MQKTILITGSTDGIGLEAAKRFASLGHHVLLHGRNPAKLQAAENTVKSLSNGGTVEAYVADLSVMANVETLAKAVAGQHNTLDVLINNAGIYNAPEEATADGLDVRFAVNTVAPYLLTQRLLPLMGPEGRVINLSSAAQAPVNLKALQGGWALASGEAYAQSKLALTMWSCHMGLSLQGKGPMVVAVNPGSYLASKMVKEAFGMAGRDIGIGAEILERAALSEDFADATGQYFDNDAGRFAQPHPYALDPQKQKAVIEVIEQVLAM